MSARVEIDASGSQSVLPATHYSFGWGYHDERSVECDLRLSFHPDDAALAERQLDLAIERARRDLARFLPN